MVWVTCKTCNGVGKVRVEIRIREYKYVKCPAGCIRGRIEK